MFSAWKSQIDADFGLYKSTRDGFDVLSAKQNQDAFNLYKSQRDSMEHDGFMSLEDRNYPRRHEDDGFMDVFDSRSNRFGDRFRDSGMRGNDMDRIIKYMRHSMNDGEHFTESEAMDLVSDMYHTEGGRKYSGEKFDIHNVDQKIIESAIIFWFKDVDCKSRNKVVSYFKEY